MQVGRHRFSNVYLACTTTQRGLHSVAAGSWQIELHSVAAGFPSMRSPHLSTIYDITAALAESTHSVVLEQHDEQTKHNVQTIAKLSQFFTSKLITCISTFKLEPLAYHLQTAKHRCLLLSSMKLLCSIITSWIISNVFSLRFSWLLLAWWLCVSVVCTLHWCVCLFRSSLCVWSRWASSSVWYTELHKDCTWYGETNQTLICQ